MMKPNMKKVFTFAALFSRFIRRLPEKGLLVHRYMVMQNPNERDTNEIKDSLKYE